MIWSEPIVYGTGRNGFGILVIYLASTDGEVHLLLPSVTFSWQMGEQYMDIYSKKEKCMPICCCSFFSTQEIVWYNAKEKCLWYLFNKLSNSLGERTSLVLHSQNLDIKIYLRECNANTILPRNAIVNILDYTSDHLDEIIMGKIFL